MTTRREKGENSHGKSFFYSQKCKTAAQRAAHDAAGPLVIFPGRYLNFNLQFSVIVLLSFTGQNVLCLPLPVLPTSMLPYQPQNDNARPPPRRMMTASPLMHPPTTMRTSPVPS